MASDYKKYRVIPDDPDNKEFEIFSTAANAAHREDEIYAWIERLTRSAGIAHYSVEDTDATWAEATIREDRLFETHHQ